MHVYGISLFYEIGMISLGCSCIQSYAFDLPGHVYMFILLSTTEKGDNELGLPVRLSACGYFQASLFELLKRFCFLLVGQTVQYSRESTDRQTDGQTVQP